MTQPVVTPEAAMGDELAVLAQADMRRLGTALDDVALPRESAREPSEERVMRLPLRSEITQVEPAFSLRLAQANRLDERRIVD